MISDDWKLVFLEDVAAEERFAIVDGPFGSNLKSEHYRSDGIPVLQSGFVTSGKFIAHDYMYVQEELFRQQRRSAARAGDILMAKIGAKAGRCALIPEGHPLSILAGNSIKITVNPLICDSTFLRLRLGFDYDQNNLASIRSTTAQPAISLNRLKKYKILLPPLGEQAKIAEILTCWDKAIELVERLLEEKRVAFSILRQSLISGTIRFPEFQGSQLNESRFDSFLTESRIAGSDGRTARKLTIKLYGKGIAPKSISREGSESTRYFRRKAGQFIYSKLDFLNGAFAIIPGELDEYESTLDLPAFDISQSVNPQWLLYYVSRPEFYRNKLDIAAGGRKARRVNPADFLALDLKLPSRSEQDRISEVLERGQREIGLLEDYHKRLMDQKRGLMQKLLTGKIRVKV